MIEKQFKSELIDVKNVLGSLGVKFWLDYGTLLGAIREGKTIKGDNDIDLSTMYINSKKISTLSAKFKEKGFSVSKDYQKQFGITAIKLKRDTEYSYDLHFLKKRRNKTWGVLAYTIRQEKPYKFIRKIARAFLIQIKKIWPKFLHSKLGKSISKIYYSVYKGTLIRKKNIHQKLVAVVIPSEFYQKFDKIKFYGIVFYVPHNPKKYLAFRYGHDWMTPNSNWFYWRDDGAIDHNWKIN